MEFKVNNRELVLHGLKLGSVRETKAKQLHKLRAQNVQLAMLCNHIHDMNPFSTNATLPSDIAAVLNEFEDVFKEPTKLPPSCSDHGHRISLLEATNPINQRPYRYSLS